MHCRNTFSGPWCAVSVVGVQPWNPHDIFFGIVQFKDTDSRDAKTPRLAHDVQWYRWLGRHSRTQTIFSGIVQFKETHSRDA